MEKPSGPDPSVPTITVSKISPIVEVVTKSLLSLGIADTDQIALILGAVRDQVMVGGPIAEVLGYIWSDHFQCPGGHYSRRLTWDEEEVRRGCYHDRKSGFVMEEKLPEGVFYIGERYCLQDITVALEEEGGTYYPVADGPCVEALGWDDEPFYDSTVLAKWEERARLRNFIEGSTTRQRIQANRVLRILKEGKERKKWQAEQHIELRRRKQEAEEEETARLLGWTPPLW